MVYPDTLEKLIGYLKKLPSVGEKSAERMALTFLTFSEESLQDFSKVIKDIKKNLKPCKICGQLTEQEVCCICDDSSRDKKLICILEDYKSAFAFEKIGNYKGTYHILNGLISPMDNVYQDDINISSLVKRVEENPDCELIIALKSTLEGEMTTLYLNKILKDKKVSISRLSYGLPMGAEIDYLDAITLERALEDRKNIT